MLKRLPALAAVWLVYTSSLFAQTEIRSVDVSVVPATTFVTTRTVTETIIKIDSQTAASEESVSGGTKETTAPVGWIKVGGNPAGVLVQAFDQNFQLASTDRFGDNGWAIRKPGRYLVFVQVPGEVVPVQTLIVPGSIADPPPPPPPGGDAYQDSLIAAIPASHKALAKTLAANVGIIKTEWDAGSFARPTLRDGLVALSVELKNLNMGVTDAAGQVAWTPFWKLVQDRLTAQLAAETLNLSKELGTIQTILER